MVKYPLDTKMTVGQKRKEGFMKKISELICKYRVLILIVAIVLLIPSIIGYKATRVNYDILVYLPDSIKTVQGQNILSEDFNTGAYSIVVLDNMPTKE